MRKLAALFPKHIVINGQNVALVAKTASSSLSLHSAAGRRPPITLNKKPISSFSEEVKKRFWHLHAVRVEDPQTSLLLVRDPIERFKSACGHLSMDVDLVLSILERGGVLTRDFHFQPLESYKTSTTLGYRFPEHLPEFCARINLTELVEVNHDKDHEVTLTAEQEARAREFFANDIVLREAVEEAGTQL